MSTESTDSATRNLLVFGLEGALFGVDASDVDAVVSWTEPVPLPRGGTAVLGVVQDRGRIVSVLRHPSGAERSGDDEPRRIVICRTRSGLLGLPASSTRAIAPVAIFGEVIPGGVVDTGAGTLTYIVPDAIADRIAGPRHAREDAALEGT
jgi:hypothetical protein